MGLFDIAVFDTTCPQCGQSHEWRAQFKYGYCRQHEYYLGDAICWFDPPCRLAPLSDAGENVGGRVNVDAVLESPCAICGFDGEATLWLRDNTLERAEIANKTDGPEFVHIEPAHRWMRFWSRRARAPPMRIGWSSAAAATDGRLLLLTEPAGWQAEPSLHKPPRRHWPRWVWTRSSMRAVGELRQQVDRKLEADPAAGETTVVVMQMRMASSGPSVGDSGALLIDANGTVDLTAHQQRKPLLGSGTSRPVGIRRQPIAGRLLVRTDGLLKYAQPAKIRALASSGDLQAAVGALLEAATLPSGSLHDDVAMVLGEVVGQQAAADRRSPSLAALDLAPAAERRYVGQTGPAACLRALASGCTCRRMPRMQVYLPEPLYTRVKARGLPVSELLQKALAAELRRLDLLAETDRYVQDLVAEVGEPSAAEQARAEAFVRKIKARSVPKRRVASEQAQPRPLFARPRRELPRNVGRADGARSRLWRCHRSR